MAFPYKEIFSHNGNNYDIEVELKNNSIVAQAYFNNKAVYNRVSMDIETANEYLKLASHMGETIDTITNSLVDTVKCSITTNGFSYKIDKSIFANANVLVGWD
jgi:hypothetical protein